MAYIYVITNQINGKQYVGKTNDSIENRFQQHLREAKKPKVYHRPLYVAIKKYGPANFTFDQLEECSELQAPERERYWIKELGTYGSHGYNATCGGDGKTLYNYKELSEEYLRLGSILSVCQKYGCDKWVVHNACKQYGVTIKSGQDISRELFSKQVKMFDKNDNFISDFPSLHSAAKYCINNCSAKGTESAVMGKISLVARGIRKSAYGYVWRFSSEL